MRRWIIGTVAVLIVGVAVASQFVSATVSEPDYQTLREDGRFEVRRYEPTVRASVRVDGTLEDALDAGFEALSDYIFGANVADREIAMTAPVLIEPELVARPDTPSGSQGELFEAIVVAGTDAPDDPDGRWTVSFVMPEGSALGTLPAPDDGAVELNEAAPVSRAVVTFSGAAGAEDLQRRTDQLTAWLHDNGLDPEGPPEFAFYDPPWTLPFLRRNEVIVTVDE